jgi:hypothetical protein
MIADLKETEKRPSPVDMMNDYKKWVIAQPVKFMPVPMTKMITDPVVARLAVPMAKMLSDDTLSRGSENTSDYI